MRPVNLFLTKEGVLKLGYYGLITQAECYGTKGMNCDGIRSFAYEVFEGEYEMESDVWSFGVTLIEMMGIRPYSEYDTNDLPTKNGEDEDPCYLSDVESHDAYWFICWCFDMEVDDRWSVDKLLDVSRIGWGMMNRVHFWRNAKRERRKGCSNW